jgi:hypothetical protein
MHGLVFGNSQLSSVVYIWFVALLGVRFSHNLRSTAASCAGMPKCLTCGRFQGLVAALPASAKFWSAALLYS